MKIRVKCKDWGWMLFLCVLPAFCGGCSEEQPDVPEGITFRLSLPAGLEVSTRAGKDLDGITIGNVWVLQYNKANGGLEIAQCFSGNKIGNTNTNQTIEVTTSGFRNVASNFYVIANAGEAFFNSSDQSAYNTEALLKARTLAIAAGTTTEPTLLTSGPLGYDPSSSSDKDKLVIVAPLQRAFARVVVQWSGDMLEAGAQAAISKITVKNLPATMALYTRGGGALNTAYPSAATAQQVIVNSSLAAGTKATFYMAENLRGTGTGTSFAEKNLAVKGPGGNLNGCTYLEMEGTYTYPRATDVIGMKYCIYLGGNLMNDYNIQRGNSYQLTVNISGANSADIRVTITNGNVIMFDEVEVIRNEVNF